MNNFVFKKIGFIGLGLIGGSLALRIREKCSESYIYAVSRSTETVEYAKAQKIINDGSTDILDLPDDLNLIYICTPIDLISDYINSLSKKLSNSVIFTDVGSIKQSIVKKVSLDKPNHVYIPGHPMAGIEKTGIKHASSEIIANAPYILVPQQTKEYALLSSFISSLDFKVIELSAESHDKLVCYSSHIPYLLSGMPIKNCSALNKEELTSIKNIASSGFRDTTRVSSSDPEWGAQVCLANKKQVLDSIKLIRDNLEHVEGLLCDENYFELIRYFQGIKELRDSFF